MAENPYRGDLKTARAQLFRCSRNRSQHCGSGDGLQMGRLYQHTLLG